MQMCVCVRHYLVVHISLFVFVVIFVDIVSLSSFSCSDWFYSHKLYIHISFVSSNHPHHPHTLLFLIMVSFPFHKLTRHIKQHTAPTPRHLMHFMHNFIISNSCRRNVDTCLESIIIWHHQTHIFDTEPLSSIVSKSHTKWSSIVSQYIVFIWYFYFHPFI